MRKQTYLFAVLLLGLVLVASRNRTEEPNLQIFKKQHPFDTDLFRAWTRIHDLTTDFQITKPSHMTAIGHINVVHRGIPFGGKTEYAVGYALKLTLKYSETQSGLGPDNDDIFPPEGDLVVGSITGDNINGASDHYSLGSFEGYELLTTPGWYRLEVWGVSHSDISIETDGLIEVNPSVGETTYNQIIVRVEDASNNSTDVEEENRAIIPEKVKIGQNFPNPFNPTTTINYSLPKSEYVLIKVYNMNGQEVKTLVEQEQPQGEYSITWNGENSRGILLPSGVYFYKIQAGKFQKALKMSLVK